MKCTATSSMNHGPVISISFFYLLKNLRLHLQFDKVKAETDAGREWINNYLVWQNQRCEGHSVFHLYCCCCYCCCCCCCCCCCSNGQKKKFLNVNNNERCDSIFRMRHLENWNIFAKRFTFSTGGYLRRLGFFWIGKQ